MTSSCRNDGTITQRSRRCVYVVYDLADNECVVTFGSTLKELTLFFNSNINTIKKMIYQGFCLYGRYVAEKIFI